LQVQNGHKYHGKEVPPVVVYNGTEEKVRINFQTDWGTSTYLDFPKGFLLYFHRKFFCLYLFNTKSVDYFNLFAFLIYTNC
jgi:hypothetical protein